MSEYRLMIKALRLKKVDEDHVLHKQAFLNFAVQATKKEGRYKSKPVYTNFKKFFNLKEEERKVLEPKKSPFAGIGKILRKEGKR